MSKFWDCFDTVVGRIDPFYNSEGPLGRDPAFRRDDDERVLNLSRVFGSIEELHADMEERAEAQFADEQLPDALREWPIDSAVKCPHCGQGMEPDLD
jgi:hypothetical protein